jgi:hypothetical protein
MRRAAKLPPPNSSADAGARGEDRNGQGDPGEGDAGHADQPVQRSRAMLHSDTPAETARTIRQTRAIWRFGARPR